MARRERNTLTVVLMGALGLAAGCELLPPNNFRIITTEPAGTHPILIHMQRGTFYQEGDHGVALLESPTAMLFFDWVGSANRVHLLFRQGPEVAVYERIGQWPWLRGTESKVTRPHGVQGATDGRQQLRGSIDVFLARSEDRDVGTRFEHFPRALRIVGYFVLPSISEPRGSHPVAAFLPPTADQPDRRPPGLVAFGGDDHDRWFSELNEQLPPLPLIDVEYLVPNLLAAVFKPLIP